MPDIAAQAVEAGLPALTDANYHTPDVNAKYMSVSQYKAWASCNSQWAARYATREYTPPQLDALAVGSYFHALVLEPHTAEDVYAENADMLALKSGKPGASARTAQEMAATS